MEELSKINSEKAKEQFQSRYEQQEAHLEETYGPVRKREVAQCQDFVNFALVNWVLTLHGFSHLKGMDLVNAINRVVMLHVTTLEGKVKRMEKALGRHGMKKLNIDPKNLYPTEVATRGLEEVQKAARLRAKAGKYIKMPNKPKIITEV